MKNLFKFFVPMAVAVISLAACNEESKVPSGANALQITVIAHQQDLGSAPAAAAPASRTYIDGNAIKWGTGEYMKIGVFDGTATTFGNSADESADVWNGDAEAMFNFSITPANASGEYTYYGLYPASSAVASGNTNPASYKVNLPSTQNATAASYDPKAYILVARPESGKTEAEADWEASFRRATALNHITLKNLSEDIKRVTITAPSGIYLAGARHIDLTTGASGDIYSGGGRTETVDIKYASKLSGGADMDIWFTSWDAEIAVDAHLVIVAYSDAHTFTRDITVVNKPITFKEGCLNTLQVNMSSAIQGDNTELEEGDYVVLAKDGSNYYALKAEKEDGKERLLSVAYEGSLASYLGDADIIWSLTKSGDSFIFANSSKYLGYKGNSNESYWLEADENWTEDNYLLDVTAQGGASDPYHVTLHSNGSRYLSKNSSSAFFAFYGNTGQKADIVFVPATVDNRTVATLSFAEDAIALTTANYDSFLGQDVTASPNVTAITEHLNWSKVDNNSVIDEFDEGVLTLTGNEGSATVTVSFAGDANYRPAEASYTIEVTSSGSVTLTESKITVGANTVKGTNSGKLAYRLGTSSNDGSLTFDAGYSSITFTLAGWASGTRSFSITNGTINSSASLSPAAGSPSGTISANFETSYSGTEYTIEVTDPTEEVVFSGRRCVVWGFTAVEATPDTRADASLAWKKGGVAANSDTASLETGDDTLPTIALDNSAHSHPVTYSSSNTDVATIVASGVGAGTITLVAAGETTISAIFAGDEDYKPLTVTYTLTVSDNRTKVATPTFSPAAGEVAENSTVTISCATDGATIHYTVDNSTPTAESAVYSSAITIDAAKTIKAIAVKADYKDSDVASAAYTIAGAGYDFETVAELNGLVTNSSSSFNGYLTDAVVSFVPATNTAIVKDATGSVMIYKSSHGLLQGQTYTGEITVTAIKYNNLYSEITAWSNATFTGDQTTVAPESVALSSLIDHFDDYQNAYVQVAGLTVVSVSTKNINVTDGVNNYVVYDNPGTATCVAGDIITAKGTITKYGSTEELKVWAAADITITGTAPKAVSFTQPTGAAATAGCSIAVTVGGNPHTSGNTVASGTTVTLTATAGTDYEFTSWNVTGATVANASASTTTFTMGTSAVSISATFTSTGGGDPEPTEKEYYKLNTTSTPVGTSNSYGAYTDIACANNLASYGTYPSTATWSTTCGSKQSNTSFWWGSNSKQSAKMNLGNGSVSGASAIATALGVTTSATYYSALICSTAFANISKVVMTRTTPGGTAPSNIYLLYTTNDGTSYSLAGTQSDGSTVTFTIAEPVASAKYAIVIKCTGYCQYKDPIITFYTTDNN